MVNPGKVSLLSSSAIKGPLNSKLNMEASSPLDPFHRTSVNVHEFTHIPLLSKRGLNAEKPQWKSNW